MTARDVYGKQEALRQAEDVLREMAADELYAQRGGAPISSGDYMRSPEGRAVEKFRDEVAAAQAEVGGVVYRVPNLNMGPLREKLDKLVKKSAKLGVGTVTYTVDPEVEEIKSTIDPMIAMVELGYIPPSVQRFRYVILDAAPVKLEGWMFLATLTVEPGGVMISKVPAFARGWALHNEGVTVESPDGKRDNAAEQAAQEQLDAMNLGIYADEKRATLCEHCGLARRRTKTHLVEHATTGEIKQVGSNCLRDFLGVDPHTILRYATYLQEIALSMDEDGFEGGGAGAKRMIGTEEYVTHVCTMIRTVGWIAASEDYKGRPTRDQAMSNITEYGKVEKGVPQFEEVIEADHQRALAAIEWAKEHLGAKVHQSQDASDFDRNLYVAANGDTIPSKGLGILAYLPVAHAKFQEREIERAQQAKQAADNPSEHVGQVKDRLELTLKVMNIYENAGDWGTTWITTLLDEETGNKFKWFASKELVRGESYTGKWTVKNHDEYKGVKETVVTRPTIARVVEGGYLPKVNEWVALKPDADIDQRPEGAGQVSAVDATHGEVEVLWDNGRDHRYLTTDMIVPADAPAVAHAS